MAMQKTVACRLDLGMTRIAGYTLYDPNSMEFHETTPREVENLVKKGLVNGLVFSKDGGLVPDMDGWSMGNLKIKSAVGRYRDMDTEKTKGDTIYSVVRAIQITGMGGDSSQDTDAGNSQTSAASEPVYIYEVINNRCARSFYTRKQLVGLANFAWVGGIRVNQETDTIELCPGVQVEQLKSIQGTGAYELGRTVIDGAQLESSIMADLFAGVTPQGPTGVFDGLKEMGESSPDDLGGPWDTLEEETPESTAFESENVTVDVVPEGTEPDGAAPEGIEPMEPVAEAGSGDTPVESETPVVTSEPTGEGVAAETGVEATAGAAETTEGVSAEPADASESTEPNAGEQPASSEIPAEAEIPTGGDVTVGGESEEPTPTEQAEAAFSQLDQEIDTEGESTPKEDPAESDESTTATRNKSSKGKSKRKR